MLNTGRDQVWRVSADARQRHRQCASILRENYTISEFLGSFYAPVDKQPSEFCQRDERLEAL